MPKELKMKQIIVAQWSTGMGHLGYSTFGLSEDGKVYRYDPLCEGWLPIGMEEATSKELNPYKRRS